MELIELRLFWPMAPPLTPRGVLSEDMIFFFFGLFFLGGILLTSVTSVQYMGLSDSLVD